MEFILSLITPVLLHMAVSVIVTAAGGAIGGAAADSAVCTSVTALLVLPVLIWMYRSDGRRACTQIRVSVVLTERSMKNGGLKACRVRQQRKQIGQKKTGKEGKA